MRCQFGNMSVLFGVCILAIATKKLRCCTNYFRDNLKLIPEIFVRAKALNLVADETLDFFFFMSYESAMFAPRQRSPWKQGHAVFRFHHVSLIQHNIASCLPEQNQCHFTRDMSGNLQVLTQVQFNNVKVFPEN